VRLNFNRIIKSAHILTISLLFFASAHAQTQAGSALNVNAVYPIKSSESGQLQLSGEIESAQVASLSSLESGMVAAFFVEAGDVVEKGDVLLHLDSKLAELELNTATASLKAAEVREKEAKRLYEEVLALSKSEVVAQTLIAERAAALANAQAETMRASAQVDLQAEVVNRHRLIAPFSGVITMRNVDEGEWITSQTTVFELVNKDKLRLRLAIPQEHYTRLAKEAKTQPVRVQVKPDAGFEAFTAAVTRIVPNSNTVSRTFTVLVDLPPDTGLIAGMSARGTLSLLSEQSNKIILPRAALKRHPDGGSSVFKIENGKAVRVVTQVDLLPNNQIAVATTDSESLYIISGIELLSDGQAVQATTVEVN